MGAKSKSKNSADINKEALLRAILDRLEQELELFVKAARFSHAEATHEQNKAEDKYDTRGLEASYLARGQSRQVAELEQAIKKFESLELQPLSSKDPINLGAYVELEGGQENSYYFVGPTAGGTEVQFEKKEVLVITPQSPLGQQLVGKKQSEEMLVDIAGKKTKYRIVRVA